MKISLSGLAVASIVGIILNAILPGKDFSDKNGITKDMKQEEHLTDPKQEA